MRPEAELPRLPDWAQALRKAVLGRLVRRLTQMETEIATSWATEAQRAALKRHAGRLEALIGAMEMERRAARWQRWHAYGDAALVTALMSGREQIGGEDA